MKTRIVLMALCFLFYAYPVAIAKDVESVLLSTQNTEEEVPTPFQKKGKWGYVNSKGKFIIKPKFEEASAFDGAFAIVKMDGKYGMIYKSGDFWYKPTFDKIKKKRFEGFLEDSFYYQFCKDGKVGLCSSHNYGFIGDYFSSDSDLPYDSIEPVTLSKNGLIFICRRNGKASFLFSKKVDPFIDSIERLEYDNITHIGRAYSIRNNNLFGYISEDFSFICKPRFSKEIPGLYSSRPVRFFDNGEAFVLTPKKVYTLREYDDYLFSTLSYKDYEASDQLPSWLKCHLVPVEEKDDEKVVAKQSYNRVRKMSDFREWFTYSINSRIDAKFDYFYENNGDDEIRHPILDNAHSNGYVASFYRNYNTKKVRMIITPIYNYQNIPHKTSQGFGTVEYRFSSSNAKDVDIMSLVDRLIRSNEDVNGEANVTPLSFGVLSNGNFLLKFNVKHDFRERTLAIDPPTYKVILGHLVMVNDGLYHETLSSSFNFSVILDKRDFSVVSYIHPDNQSPRYLIDSMGGFFGCNDNVIADKEYPIIKYDNEGKLLWSYSPKEGDSIFWLDGTNTNWYFAGKTTSRGVIGGENALLLTLDNNGNTVDFSVVKDYKPYEDVKVYNDKLYVKDPKWNSFKAVKNLRVNEYSPKVESINWGDGSLYACGIQEKRGEWLIPPVLPHEKPVAYKEWKIYPFEDHYAIVYHKDRRLFISESGETISSLYNYPDIAREIEVDSPIPYKDVEVKPLFDGGDPNNFTKWINSQLVYPLDAIKDNIQGRIVVQITILKDGTVANAKVLRGVSPSLDMEAIRVVSSSPKWTPGFQNGQPINVTYIHPIIFQLK